MLTNKNFKLIKKNTIEMNYLFYFEMLISKCKTYVTMTFFEFLGVPKVQISPLIPIGEI